MNISHFGELITLFVREVPRVTLMIIDDGAMTGKGAQLLLENEYSTKKHYKWFMSIYNDATAKNYWGGQSC